MIALPAHLGPGAFDHAAVDTGRGLLFVAHTANDAVDVIDTHAARHVRSIDGLKGVAGALTDSIGGLVFSSNRGENTIAMFAAEGGEVTKVGVGLRPNGLAHDPGRGTLLCANVGDPGAPGSASVTIVDVASRAVRATIAMPGRTRWAIFDPDQDRFFVNIADPAEIVIVDARSPDRIAGAIPIPQRGPHGLDLDAARHLLYCACDDGQVCAVDIQAGHVVRSLALSGPPDVVFYNPALNHLYVAIGDPGVIDVVDVARWTRVETVVTEPGAHTLAFDAGANRVYAFLPRSHRALVFEDEPAAGEAS
ncbi:MAG TPA: YncE family protein [Candidatus Eisenbacteria bacterium]|nr:YncE family protein [Candidatus Eisenbacteria bacterium]